MSGTLVTSSPIANCIGNLPDTSLANFINAVLSFFGSNAHTLENYIGLAAWSACEGPAASQGGYNPLNTTWPGGKTNGTTKQSKAGPVTLPAGNAAYLGNNPQQNGGNPVKNYAGWASGVSATVATILGTGIAGVLKNGGSSQAIAVAVGQAHWGTNPSCISTKISEYQSNPQALCAALSQNVNTSTAPAGATDKGGSGQTADQGAAVPVGPSLPDWASGLTAILSHLTSVTFWKRVGLGIIGLLLMGTGISLILGESKTVREGATAAGEAALL